MRKQCRVKKSTKNNFDSILLIICSMQSSCVWRLVQLPHKMQTTSAHARIEGNKKKKLHKTDGSDPENFVLSWAHTRFFALLSLLLWRFLHSFFCIEMCRRQQRSLRVSTRQTLCAQETLDLTFFILRFWLLIWCRLIRCTFCNWFYRFANL